MSSSNLWSLLIKSLSSPSENPNWKQVTGVGVVITMYLAILDNLERAKNAMKNDDVLKSNKDLNKFLDNISILQKDLVSIFERNKIFKIETKGKKFDPNLHQAMVEIEDEKSEIGTVIQEIQSGYMIGERLLRPALVGVAKKKNSKNGENNEKKD